MPMIDSTTRILGRVHFERDKYDKKKKRLRDEWFQEASATFSPEALARKTVKVPLDCQDNPEDYATLYHPGWRVVEVVEDSVLIEEDPEFKPFVQIVMFDSPQEILDDKDNPVLRYGYVITRSIVSGQMLIDDERVIVNDPELWQEVTEWANYELILRLEVFNADIWNELAELDWPRQVKPVESLTPGQIARLQPYLYEGPKTAKLLVRYAKENESE